MNWNRVWVAIGLAVLLAHGAAAQVTTRVSVSSAGRQARGASGAPSMSPDGRWVAFSSWARNLFPGDTSNWDDVFVHDRQTGITECASLDNNGAVGNEGSRFPSITPDGRFVVFWSIARTLVPGDTNMFADIFVRDRLTGTTERVSVDSGGAEGNGACGVNPKISADGRFVVFSSTASNLVPGDLNDRTDIFVRDRVNGTTELVSVDSNGIQSNQDSDSPGISADGRFVLLCSNGDNLVPGDTNQSWDVFVHDRLNGATERVSLDSNGVEGDSDSSIAAISATGDFVVFRSWATNLVPGVPVNPMNHLLRDRSAGTTEVIGTDSNDNDAVLRHGNIADHAISADGRFVVFRSWSSDLVPGDTNGRADIFIRDRQNGTIERVSVNSGGGQPLGSSFASDTPCVSDDGRLIAFSSVPNNLVPNDTNQMRDVFVRDRQIGAGTTNFSSLCDPGAGNVIVCPCSNPPAGPDRGCDNSASSGGASLTASGNTQLSADGLVLTSSGEPPTSLSILIQGTTTLPSGVVYGQGVRCLGGAVRRLYTELAVGGEIRLPNFAADDPPVCVRSQQMGDVIQPGESRLYLVYYRDPTVLGGCVPSSTFNATQTGQVTWLP